MNKLQQFHALHHTEDILFLGNAWDLLSALALEKAGFQAIGTTSWGIASTYGFADGEHIDFETHLGMIKMIAHHVSIPVSADIEAGYGEDRETIVNNVLRTADVGVAGINIEDSPKRKKGLNPIDQHANLLSDIRNALDRNGFKDFYINARIDTYFRMEVPFEETILRAKAYVQSGASGIFVPGIRNEEEILKISQAIDAPLNILSIPGLTQVDKLKELGVKRYSIGNAFSDHVTAYMDQCAAQLLELRDTAFLYT
ncbi:carboxyphosphonoenolpyruvate phosphonomutase [Paenibacillus selenitireducens]|uniref:Carboxyphosphonoenolpyruvate phosphonomutase n=1 Tax=Paenibacillus selenitireducens TaxID=1324314 RepID=A0A1T2X2N3_9BACL|nr:isocitrate lyase/phosphoenolpyruvate mutase family protein [Paenibacillus selenitireducens]OPA74151.1 carboxyphosphonoenolpyruvate phosphonomutase [Paenibacillus selenitireducens]